jgi:hypothetical protein
MSASRLVVQKQAFMSMRQKPVPARVKGIRGKANGVLRARARAWARAS